MRGSLRRVISMGRGCFVMKDEYDKEVKREPLKKGWFNIF